MNAYGYRRFTCTGLVACSCLCFGCSGSNDQSESALIATSLEFQLEVNDEGFSCGHAYKGVGNPPADFSISDARFYVSEIQFVEPSGKAHNLVLDENAYQNKNVALIDLEDGCGSDGTSEIHPVVTGKAPPLAYDRVRFTLGVPKERNFIDLASASPPLDVTAMFWVWQSGYKFLKIDGASPAEAGGINPFFIHLGSGGCPGERPSSPPTGECAFPNRVTYELGPFSGTASKVVADVGALLATSNVSTNTEGTPPGCMSSENDPECATIFPRIGIDSLNEQELFRLE